MLARLNNQAPSLNTDGALDYLTFTSGGATSLLNQTNPAPSAPQLLPTTTTLSSNPTTAAPTQPIAFTVQVTGVRPSGTATFTSGGASLGTTSLFPFALGGSATLSAAFPSPGTYTVSAAYAGDSNNQPSSSATLSVTVAKVPSSGTVSISSGSTGAKQVFTFVANLSGYAPSGLVTFFLADGTATLTYSFLTAGTYNVYATYAGDVANLPSTTPNFTVQVYPQDFNMYASGNAATISPGQGATGTLTITPMYGFTDLIKFSCSGLVAGEACIFTPSTVQTLSGFNPVTATFVITTTAPTLAHLNKLFEPFERITWAGLFGLIFFRKRLQTAKGNPILPTLVAVLLAASLLQLAACTSSPSTSSTTTQNKGTPPGTQTIVITAADASGTPSHTVSVQLTID